MVINQIKNIKDTSIFIPQFCYKKIIEFIITGILKTDKNNKRSKKYFRKVKAYKNLLINMLLL
jgi:hypothetical protein